MSEEKGRKPIFIRAINWINEMSGYLSAFALFFAALIIFYKVLVRYFLGIPTIWQTELSIYLLMFVGFVGAAYGLKHGAHVYVDLVVVKLPPRVQSGVRIIVSILGLVLTVLLDYRAWHMWWIATEKGWHSETLWGPPLTIPYFILPLGMALVSLQFLSLIYEEIICFKNGGRQESEEESQETV
ncbi:MAG TPA: TRAP transporter small permease [Bacillales bacterium]|nr:TRAP transporter small permease [Bacillales bacterium]